MSDEIPLYDPEGADKHGDFSPWESDLEVGQSHPAYPEIISVQGYDPVDHNLFGLDILYQDVWWKDATGRRVRLVDMTKRHRRNLLAFLRRNAASIELADGIISLTGPFAPRGDMASDAADHALDQRGEDPVGWLETTPFVVKLRELVEHDRRRKLFNRKGNR